jgi:hypothetical protein
MPIIKCLIDTDFNFDLSQAYTHYKKTNNYLMINNYRNIISIAIQ